MGGGLRAARGSLRAIVRPARRSGLRDGHDGDPLQEAVADALGLDPADLGERYVHEAPLVRVHGIQETLLAPGLRLLRRAQGDLHNLVLLQLAEAAAIDLDLLALPTL